MFVIIISFILLLLLFFGISEKTSAAELRNEHDLMIICNRTSLEMEYGGEATIELNIRNIGNRTQYVYLEWIFPEASGLTSGKFSENYFPLEPNESKKIELYLYASKSAPQGEGAEDGHIQINWGKNLNLTSEGSLKFGSNDYETSISINITKTGFSSNMIYILIISGIIGVVSITIIIFIIFKIQKK